MTFPSGSAARAALERGAGEREGTACSSLLSPPRGPHGLSRILQVLCFFLSAADIFSSGTSYVTCFRWRHISFPAQWHVSPRQAFRRDSWTWWGAAISNCLVEHPWAACRGEVRGCLPMLWLSLPPPLKPPRQAPVHQVHCVDLWTAVAKLRVPEIVLHSVLCIHVAQVSSSSAHHISKCWEYKGFLILALKERFPQGSLKTPLQSLGPSFLKELLAYFTGQNFRTHNLKTPPTLMWKKKSIPFDLLSPGDKVKFKSTSDKKMKLLPFYVNTICIQNGWGYLYCKDKNSKGSARNAHGSVITNPFSFSTLTD